MSLRRAIDGEEPLFQFDSFEASPPSVMIVQSSSTSQLDSNDLMDVDMSHTSAPPHVLPPHSSASASTMPETTDYLPENCLSQSTSSVSIHGQVTSVDKGKAPSRPVDIQRSNADPHRFDQFSFSNNTRMGRARISSLPSSSMSTPQTLASFHFSPSATPISAAEQGSSSLPYSVFTPGTSYASDEEETDGDMEVCVGKGKGREVVPSLPPLSFSPTDFVRGETNWPSIVQTPAEEAPQQTVSPNNLSTPFPITFPLVTPAEIELEDPTHRSRVPGRSRSFSSLSTRSAKSFAARSMTRIRLNWARKTPSNLARKLLLGKRGESSAAGCLSNSDFTEPLPPTPVQFWPQLYSPTDDKPLSFSEPATPYLWPTGSIPRTPLDLVPFAPDDLLVPVHVPKINLFDTLLPKEVKIDILKTLIDLYVADERRITSSSSWSALKASSHKYRWMGKEKAYIELVRLAQVSKAWRQLVLDGQLWSTLDLHAFPWISSAFLQRLAATSGSFVNRLNLAGHPRLSTKALLALSRHICIPVSPLFMDRREVNQLMELNLNGCTAVTTHSLHTLLSSSPRLRTLRLKGVQAVNNATFGILAERCPLLSALDCSRCHHMDADGLIALLKGSSSSPPRSCHPLKQLRASGLKRADGIFMKALGRYAPLLEVLDLSGARSLHNSAIDAFVAVADEEECSSETIMVISRELGRDPGDPTKHRRRVTRLRHLSLSSCPLLSDTACSHLAHSVPKLEFLELAGIGADIRDDGLVRLFRTTPYIRRIDLEEANEVTDETLRALSPSDADDSNQVQPGSRLEHITLSYAIQITNEALSALVHNCHKLTSLEVDNTRISGAVVKEFVSICRRRKARNAEIVAIDARGVNEGTVKELSGSSRTRKGWRSWEARKLNYLDFRDEEELGIGQDECDDLKVTVKTFYSWQMVDAVEAAREKRRKSRRRLTRGTWSSSVDDDELLNSRPTSRWWSPGGRRFGSQSTSPVLSNNIEREGCVIM